MPSVVSQSSTYGSIVHYELRDTRTVHGEIHVKLGEKSARGKVRPTFSLLGLEADENRCRASRSVCGILFARARPHASFQRCEPLEYPLLVGWQAIWLCAVYPASLDCFLCACVAVKLNSNFICRFVGSKKGFHKGKCVAREEIIRTGRRANVGPMSDKKIHNVAAPQPSDTSEGSQLVHEEGLAILL